MMTTKHTNIRSILFTCLSVLLFFITGCTAQTIAITPSSNPTNTPRPPTAIPPTPTTIPRLPLSADEVKTFATEFERITNAHLQATMNGDFDQMRQLYTEDIVHHDQNVEYAKGIENVILLQKDLISYFPNFETRLANTFIGHDDGFLVENTWGWAPYDYKSDVWSSDYPLINYSWMTLRDGKISYWWLFYGEEVFSVQGKSFDSKMQQDYAAVWSSGDSEAVASLYTPEAVRQDTLFSENQQGNSTIKVFATHFFAWYPGVHLTLVETFGEYPKVIKRGGIYTLSVSDPSGQPCDVNMLVLLEPDESQQKISQEWVFYNADSLIACGWAR